MNTLIQICSCQQTGKKSCSLTPWGCQFISTPFDGFPKTEKEKAKLFSAVYKEAKSKGVLECPYYNSLFIDEALEKL